MNLLNFETTQHEQSSWSNVPGPSTVKSNCSIDISAESSVTITTVITGEWFGAGDVFVHGDPPLTIPIIEMAAG